ncbi:hypothetical protein MRA_2853 [Mycobacterium tuberculosis H37Ra]|nr:hypothetical protein MRA_2853 [Mycobacterium tuberculosis H37Ra]
MTTNSSPPGFRGTFHDDGAARLACGLLVVGRAAASQHGGEPGHRTRRRARRRRDFVVRAGLACRTGTHPTGDSGAVLASAAGRARSHRRYHALGRRHGGGAALVVPRRSGRPVDLRHRDRTRLAAGDQGPAATQSSAPTTGHRLVAAPIVEGMCRNITELRGLQPPATPVEIAAAARQYVRKVSGITHPSAATAEAFEAAVAEVTATTTRLLDALPPRRQPPKTVPPLRRPDVAARLAGSR